MSPRGGSRPGAGRPKKAPGATTVWLSAETRAALTATLRPGDLGLLGGFQIGWTAREHQIERRIKRSSLPPARSVLQ